MCITSTPETRAARGFTLVELVMFIAMVGAAVGGVLAAYHAAARDSADPVVVKQALAVARSLLEEIQQMPFTYCDPDDPAAVTAAGTVDCTIAEAAGPEAGESRYSLAAPFDNVNDYHGYSTSSETPTGIKDLSGAPVTGLAAYDAAVTVTESALPGVPAADSLLITVTVTGPGNVSVQLGAYRTRYAPRL
jgi:MSHA pilin protein MshD